MNRARALRRLGLTAWLLGGLFVAEAGWLVGARSAAVTSRRLLAQRQAEWRALQAREPAPTVENSAAITAALAATRETHAAMMAPFTREGMAEDSPAKIPATRAEAYFDLSAFVERLRATAEARGVEVLPEGARFGFASYGHNGPDDAERPLVFRQQRVVERLVGRLLDAQPATFVSVKREAVSDDRERSNVDVMGRRAALRTNATPAANDYFVLDKRLSVRVADVIETTGVEVSFIGQTSTLRAFLHALAQREPAMVVREIEVEALPTETRLRSSAMSTPTRPASMPSYVLTVEGGSAAAARSSVDQMESMLVIEATACRFRVVVEAVELVIPAGRARGV